MPWIPTDAMLRRDRRTFGADDRGQKVLVEFRRPVPEAMTAEFYRVGLYREQMAGSEETFYRADVFQPSRVGVRKCPACGGQLVPINEQTSWCRNPQCVLPSGEPSRGKLFVTGPVRGVVRVQTPKGFVVERAEKTVRTVTVPVVLVRGCELVLDRRYPDAALLAVKRAAGALCDHYGWGML